MGREITNSCVYRSTYQYTGHASMLSSLQPIETQTSPRQTTKNENNIILLIKRESWHKIFINFLPSIERWKCNYFTTFVLETMLLRDSKKILVLLGRIRTSWTQFHFQVHVFDTLFLSKSLCLWWKISIKSLLCIKINIRPCRSFHLMHGQRIYRSYMFAHAYRV